MDAYDVPYPICEVYQILDYRQSEFISSDEGQIFYVKVELEFVSLLDDTTALDEFEELVSTIREVTREFLVHAKWLLHHPTSGKDTVWYVLGEMGMPRRQEYEFMVQRILGYASFMASDESNKNLKVLPMYVFISFIDPHNGEGLNEVGMDDYNTPPPPPLTASEIKSSVERLKSVVVAGSKTICGVCLEDIGEGREAKCTPCSHIYHGECIVKWLENGRYCPLCRFELRSL